MQVLSCSSAALEESSLLCMLKHENMEVLVDAQPILAQDWS
jgi:hypothetical protein